MQAALPYARGLSYCSSIRPTPLHVSQTVQFSTARRAAGTTPAAASTPAAADGPATAAAAGSNSPSAVPEEANTSGIQVRSRRQKRATRGQQTTSNDTPLVQDQQLPEQLPPQQQQQQQEQVSMPEQPAVQQPRIVLTPLSNTSPAAAGSIFRSSQLGSWSAMESAGPVSSPDTYVKSAAQDQQQQQQQWQKQNRHDQQHRHRQQQSRQHQARQDGAQWSPEQQVPHLQQQQGWEGQTQVRQAQQWQQQHQLPPSLTLPGPLPLPRQQQWQQRQQLPSPQHQQRQQRRHQQQWRQQQQQQEQAGVDAKLLTEARQLTLRLSRVKDLNQLWAVLSESHQSPAFNLVNISTAYKTCADLFLKQPRHQQEQQVLQQQQQQQQQQQLSLDDAAAVQGNGAFDKVLLLLDQQTALHLSMAAAAASKMASSSSSSTAAPLGSSPEWNVRSLSGIVHSCARMRRKLPWAVLVLLLEAFLTVRHQDQQPLLPLAQEDGLQQQQRQQQQQHQQGPQDQLRPMDRGESAAAIAAAPNSSSSSSSSSSNESNSSSGSSSSSSKQTEQQATCHALSLLCWGLSKLGFTTSSVYQHSSSSSSRREEDQQRRLEQQQQYWGRLAAVGARVAMEGSPRSLSTLCYAFAAGGFKDVALWGRLGAAAVRHMRSFTPHEFAQTLWAFATAGVAYKPMLTEACAVAVELAPGLTPQGLGNVLWALTTQIGYVPPSVIAATQEACLRMDMDQFGSVNITILIGALARQGGIRMELAVAINRAVERNLHTFSPDNVCKALSGLGVLNCLQQPLMDAVEPWLLNDLRSGTVDVQQACHGVWGIAITDPSRALNLLPALLQLGSQRVHILARSSDAASKLCATMALTRYRDDAFVDRLAQYLTTGRADAAPTAAPAAAAAAPVSGGSSNSDGWSTMSAGAAAHGIGVGSPLCHWDRPATPKHIVSIAVMLAKLGFCQRTTLLEALIQRFLELTPAPSRRSQDRRNHRSSSSSGGGGGFGGNSYAQEDDPMIEIRKAQTRDLAVRLLWCAAVLDMRQPTQLLLQLLKHLKGAADLSTAGMAQLVQVHMWLQTLGPVGTPLITAIPTPILQEAEIIWRKQLVPYVVHSQLHSQVLTQLSAMQLPFQSEAVTLDGMFSVDVVVQYKGCAVALEVLGPDHYTSNAVRVSRVGTSQQQQQQQQQEQHALLGPELLRFRLLAARNLALAAVSSFEASGAVATAAGAQALRQLLKQKLEEAVQLHMQYKAANSQPLVDITSSSGGQASKPTAAQGNRRARKHTQQQQQSQTEVDLSRLLLQPGLSEKQQRVRRSRAQHLEQRQQRRSAAHIYNSKQEAMQTLLTVAGRDVRADTAGAAADADASGSSGGSSVFGSVDDEGVSVVSSVEEVADRAGYDSEFDLPLDLEDLA